MKAIVKIVKKLNARGGYVYLPGKYIGKEVMVNLPEEAKNTEKQPEKKEPILIPKKSIADYLPKDRLERYRKSRMRV